MKLAQAVAEACDLEFDARNVEELADRLHNEIYSELVSFLGLEQSAPQFHYGGYAQAQASAVQTEDQRHHIILDTVFDYWVSSLTHLMVIATTRTMENREWQLLIVSTKEFFSLLTNVNQFQTVKEKFSIHLLEYSDCLNVSHALGRAMIIFVLCHELAHFQLDHFSREASEEMEFEADRLASDYFMQVANEYSSLNGSVICIDPKIACAPLALTRLFELYETWLGLCNNTPAIEQDHPAANERRSLLESLMKTRLNETA